MKISLEKALFVNRAPLENLTLDLTENEIAVLTAVNGRGKTTILSHIIDCFYEMARPHFPRSFENKEAKFYRLSSGIYNLDYSKPSFVYLRFKTQEGSLDYLDIRDNCTAEEYEDAITLENKIPFESFSGELASQNQIKKFSNLDKNKAKLIFANNILTFFPSYRFETPGYLNDPYKFNLDFNKDLRLSGVLNNPLEVITGLTQLANWVMDIVLDIRGNEDVNIHPEAMSLYNNLNTVVTQALISKNYGNLRLGIGPRNFGITRIQIVQASSNNSVYSNIFNLSSGESSMLCLFGELIRQADQININADLSQITGIVLIDEVDKHLHIKLQKEVLPRLFHLFPNVQFITSSHSPFLNMGLAELLPNRSKIIDLDTFGISKDPTTNELYTEVYEMMITENDRFKSAFESITSQIEVSNKLQIITEGKNTEYIEKAIEILDRNLLNEIKIIKGSEDRTGDQQLKNAFDILSQGNHVNKFLFVWDCDSIEIAQKVTETDCFKKFCFEENTENVKSRDTKGKATGIENLFSDTLFNEDVYELKTTPIAYGGFKDESVFSKRKFLDKVKQENEPEIFRNFLPLITKIKDIINNLN